MAFVQENAADAPVPSRHQRYPLVMHKGTHPNIASIRVSDEETERTALERGFSTDAPVIPQPEEIPVPLTLEDRVAALEDQVAALSKKKGK